MEFRGLTIEIYRVVIVACSIFSMWLMNLVLLKVFGMSQEIYTNKAIEAMDKALMKKHKDSVPLHRVMTRGIDKDGKYRRRN